MDNNINNIHNILKNLHCKILFVWYDSYFIPQKVLDVIGHSDWKKFCGIIIYISYIETLIIENSKVADKQKLAEFNLKMKMFVFSIDGDLERKKSLQCIRASDFIAPLQFSREIELTSVKGRICSRNFDSREARYLLHCSFRCWHSWHFDRVILRTSRGKVKY